jgi:hypothetical protein
MNTGLLDRRFGIRMLLICFVALCSAESALAKNAAAEEDSSKVYGNIEKFSNRNKFTKLMYGLVFKPVALVLPGRKSPTQPQIPYRKYEGKIIRDIDIITLDPFGFSVYDTSIMPQNMLTRAGNNLHIKTQSLTVYNTLLIRKNQPLDSLLVMESERLIRSQVYVGDVLFRVVPVDKTADSVDVCIRVLDKWSIIPNVDASSARTKIGLTENNFIGFGHVFQSSYAWNHSNGKGAFSADYTVPNIRNSYVNTALHYNIDEYDNFSRSISVERPFYSPLARWAAGLDIAQAYQRDTFADTVPGYISQVVNVNTQDYWAGKATRILKGNTEDERTTNAITSARYLRVRYPEKPTSVFDSVHRYSDEDFYLSALGISSRRYLQDRYIFNFGVIEDVPVGNVFGLTGGYQIRNNTGRLYLGARVSFGGYNEWGYVSSTFEYGTFFLGPSVQQGVFAASANYFGNMWKIGQWGVRQFVKPQVTLGLNRYSYDSLTINNENGIRGFNGAAGGTKKIVLTLQTQSYAPWNLWGFRFGPYLVGSIGSLGNATTGFKNSRVYSQLGIGTLIRNDYLVLNNFQLSIAFYPEIPGNGYNVFKVNAFKTTDFGLRDFDFGKPETVPFQ